MAGHTVTEFLSQETPMQLVRTFDEKSTYVQQRVDDYKLNTLGKKTPSRNS